MRKYFKNKVYKQNFDELWGNFLHKNKAHSRFKTDLLLKFKEYLKGFEYQAHVNQRAYPSYVFVGVLRSFTRRVKANYILNGALTADDFTLQQNKCFMAFNSIYLDIKSQKKFIVKHAEQSSEIEFLILPNVNYIWNVKTTNTKMTQVGFSTYQRSLKRILNIKRIREFFYNVHIIAPRSKKLDLSVAHKKHLYYKKLSLFYGFKKPDFFIKLLSKYTSLKTTLESDFLLKLEGRLENFLYRLNFFPSMYFIKQFLLSKNVLVNNSYVIDRNYFLQVFDFVTIIKSKFKFVYKLLKYRLLKKKSIFLNVPRYIEMDYKLLIACFIKKPMRTEITFPAGLFDYSTWMGK